MSFPKLSLFTAYGVELEYMIVDQATLNVSPITDQVMKVVSGAFLNEVERGDISWSNELALHVIELKTTGPICSLEGNYLLFQDHVRQINEILQRFNACLMPTAMHPWMDPFKELKLWMHEYNPIYEAYDRIFDCRGHGWANLQSTHINLPFANDEEFAKLHAAIRIILPILPAIAASSPFMEGNLTGIMDNRLNVYRNNAVKIPSITGKVIPEVSASQSHYQHEILEKMYRDIAPYDPEKILQEEWLNSRGAIARFDRFTIEIRLIDIQESPIADLAIVYTVVELLKALINGKWSSIEQMNDLSVETLHTQLLVCMREGEKALIMDDAYLALFGLNNKEFNGKVTAQFLWKYIVESIQLKDRIDPQVYKALSIILDKGCLARRIAQAWKTNPTREHLKAIYTELCDCLRLGQLFQHQN